MTPQPPLERSLPRAAVNILRFSDRHPEPPPQLPALSSRPSPAAVLAMTDSIGIMRTALGGVAERRHGYTLDDNLVALLMMQRAESMPAGDRSRLAETFASFVERAWDPEHGHFRRGMDGERRWIAERASHDSHGLAAWVLGELLAKRRKTQQHDWASRWYDRALEAAGKVEEPRAIAFAMLGASAVLRAGLEHDGARSILERGGDLLHRLLASERRPDWAWFETVLGHDNPRMPQALLDAGVILDRDEWRASAIESLAWIAEQQRAATGHFRPVGTDSGDHPYSVLPFNQQPVEAWAAIEAAARAFAITGDAAWVDRATIAHRWFFGGNDRGVVLGDLASGRCRDGITPEGANPDCSAESILAFQLACEAAAGLAGAAKPRPTRNRLASNAHPEGKAAARLR